MATSMGSLERLILALEEKIDLNDPSIVGVRHPTALVSSLKELNNMVGMNSLKESVSLQTMRLIQASNNGEKNLGMLNTILYGPPGVGKTKVGTILAKIWYSLGYLERSKKTETTWTETIKESSSEDINLMVVLVVLFITYAFSVCQFVYNTFGLYWSMIILLFVMAVVLVMLWSYGSSDEVTTVVRTVRENTSGDFPVMDDSIITVVSRRDFVGDYVGQTAGKTKKLLRDNIGKVLFIDEAYSLLNDSRDPYGIEALTSLNLFMSQHPNDIAIIMAGYKDKMQHGIFSAQPGLPRRCMWHFECQRYTGPQLAEIFIQQMKKGGWSIQDETTLRALVTRHHNLFPSFGGDTERLGFFSQLEASQDSFFGGANDKVLTSKHIVGGMRRLRDNNIHSGQTKASAEYDVDTMKKLASLMNEVGSKDKGPGMGV